MRIGHCVPAVGDAFQKNHVAYSRVGAGNARQVDALAIDALRHRPVTGLIGRQSGSGRREIPKRANATRGQVQSATLVYKRPAQRWVMSPGEVHLLSAFVSDALVNSQDRFVATNAHRLDEMKWSANGSDFEPNFDLVRVVPGYRVAPRQQQNLAVLSNLRALMKRQTAAVWEQFLPPAFIVIHVRAVSARARGYEVRTLSKSSPRPPHQIDIARLVKKLIDICAFICDDRHPKFLVFERDAPMAFQDQLGYSAAIVAIVLVGLVIH